MALISLPISAVMLIQEFLILMLVLLQEAKVVISILRNQEFCATNIQQTIHAEQSAISHAWIRGKLNHLILQ